MTYTINSKSYRGDEVEVNIIGRCDTHVSFGLSNTSTIFLLDLNPRDLDGDALHEALNDSVVRFVIIAGPDLNVIYDKNLVKGFIRDDGIATAYSPDYNCARTVSVDDAGGDPILAAVFAATQVIQNIL